MLQKTRKEKPEIENVNTINNPLSTILLRARTNKETIETNPNVAEESNTIS
jgi:hypothetical protein